MDSRVQLDALFSDQQTEIDAVCWASLAWIGLFNKLTTSTNNTVSQDYVDAYPHPPHKSRQQLPWVGCASHGGNEFTALLRAAAARLLPWMELPGAEAGWDMGGPGRGAAF